MPGSKPTPEEITRGPHRSIRPPQRRPHPPSGEGSEEWERFEDLAHKIVHVPKKDVDEKRRGED